MSVNANRRISHDDIWRKDTTANVETPNIYLPSSFISSDSSSCSSSSKSLSFISGTGKKYEDEEDEEAVFSFNVDDDKSFNEYYDSEEEELFSSSSSFESGELSIPSYVDGDGGFLTTGTDDEVKIIRMPTFLTESNSTARSRANTQETEKISFVGAGGERRIRNPNNEPRPFCTDCGQSTFTKHVFTRKRRGHCSNLYCDALLCRECKNSHVLLFHEEEGEVEGSKEKYEDHDKTKTKLGRFCRKCFMDQSNLDFSRYTQVYEPTNLEDFSGITLMLLHGVGESRSVLRSQAIELSFKYGHRCILIDLPGHGSRWEEKCSLENCVQSVSDALKEYHILSKDDVQRMDRGTILIGSSWGGYIANHVSEKLSHYFDGLIVTDCSSIDLQSSFEVMKWNAIMKLMSSMSLFHHFSVIHKRFNENKSDNNENENNFQKKIIKSHNNMMTMEKGNHVQYADAIDEFSRNVCVVHELY